MEWAPAYTKLCHTMKGGLIACSIKTSIYIAASCPGVKTCIILPDDCCSDILPQEEHMFIRFGVVSAELYEKEFGRSASAPKTFKRVFVYSSIICQGKLFSCTYMLTPIVCADQTISKIRSELMLELGTSPIRVWDLKEHHLRNEFRLEKLSSLEHTPRVQICMRLKLQLPNSAGSMTHWL